MGHQERLGFLETAVEQDDDAMEQYLEGEEPDLETIKKCIRIGTRDLEFFPTYCGSAFKDKGIQLVLDAVVDYLPSPLDVPAIRAIDVKTEEEVDRPASDEAPLSMLLPTWALIIANLYFGIDSSLTTTAAAQAAQCLLAMCMLPQ